MGTKEEGNGREEGGKGREEGGKGRGRMRGTGQRKMAKEDRKRKRAKE